MTGSVGIGLVGLAMWGWRIAAAAAWTQGVHVASCFAWNEQAQARDVRRRRLPDPRSRSRRSWSIPTSRASSSPPCQPRVPDRQSVWPEAERMEEATTVSLDRGDRSKAVPFEGRDMVVDELEELGRCVRDGTPPETGAAERMAGFRVPDPWIVAGRARTDRAGRR